jgi:hypothetical protein
VEGIRIGRRECQTDSLCFRNGPRRLSIDASEFSAPAAIHALVSGYSFCPGACEPVPPRPSPGAGQRYVRRCFQSNQIPRDREQHKGHSR